MIEAKKEAKKQLKYLYQNCIINQSAYTQMVRLITKSSKVTHYTSPIKDVSNGDFVGGEREYVFKLDGKDFVFFDSV